MNAQQGQPMAEAYTLSNGFNATMKEEIGQNFQESEHFLKIYRWVKDMISIFLG